MCCARCEHASCEVAVPWGSASAIDRATSAVALWCSRLMPIRRQHRYFYPIDWAQLSAVIRFRRAGGACEACGRPHGWMIYHLGDGRWWDAEVGCWRDGQGRSVSTLPTFEELLLIRTTKVVLATAHRDHDTANNRPANLAAFCQRCHMNHDRPEHQRRRWRTLFRRKGLGDLFQGPYPDS